MQFLLLREKLCIRNTSILNCSNLKMTKGWSRKKVYNTAVLRIQGTKFTPPCKILHLRHFCPLCTTAGLQLLLWHRRTPTFLNQTFKKNAQVNQMKGQLAKHLRARSSSMPSQLHLPIPHVSPKQNTL